MFTTHLLITEYWAAGLSVVLHSGGDTPHCAVSTACTLLLRETIHDGLADMTHTSCVSAATAVSAPASDFSLGGLGCWLVRLVVILVFFFVLEDVNYRSVDP